MARDLDDPVATMGALERFAELAVARHAPRRAAILWGAIARLRDETGEKGIPHAKVDGAELASMRQRLGDDAFDLAWREGHAMNLDEAVRYALESAGAR